MAQTQAKANIISSIEYPPEREIVQRDPTDTHIYHYVSSSSELVSV